MVYSNEEEDDDVSNNDTEKVLHIPQEQSPGGKSGIKLEKQKGHNRKEKRTTKCAAVKTKSYSNHGEEILAEKELDSINPLIKRLLIDSYKNHAKQNQTKSKRVSRSKKGTSTTSNKVSEDDDNQITIYYCISIN